MSKETTSHSRAAIALPLAILLVCWALVAPEDLHADSFGGFLEYSYSQTSSEATDSAGTKSETDSSSFMQRYFLSLDRTIFPQLRFSGGGLFEKTMNNSTSNGIDSETRGTRFIPRADLVLATPFYNAGIGYNRREDSSRTDGVSSPTSIVETMNARLGMRPEGLPLLNFFFNRTNFFDENRQSRDTTNDAYSLTANYKPVKDLELGYLGQYTKQTDRLNQLDSSTTSQNGRVSYSHQFLEGRAAMAGTYNITQQSSENIRFIASPLTPTVSFLQKTVQTPALNDNPISKDTLFDGIDNNIENVTDFILGSSSSDFTGTIFFHFELDLGTSTPTDTIFVTVKPSTILTQSQLDNIANQFNYLIYSRNNTTSNWELIAGPQPFSLNPPGTLGILDNSFKATFPDTTARFFRVVIQQKRFNVPSGPSSGINLYATELRSFFETDETSSDSLSHLLNLSGRVRLFDPGDVTYEVFYNYSKSDTDFFSATRYTLSNALRAQHRFTSALTGSARVSREDSSDTQGKRVAYLYSASLLATPLPALSHTLVYSGRTESAGSRTSSANSIYLSNFASPYQGMDLSLSAGYSTSTGESGQKTDSLSLSMGSTLAPNPKLTINLNYSGNNSKQSGGTITAKSTTTHRGDFSVSVNPVAAIYLNASYGIQTETGRETVTVQSYGGSWGILRDGTLQLNFSYSETINPTSKQKDRAIVPSMRWNIRPGSHLDISYLMSHSQTDTQDADFSSISALLRIGF